LILIEKKIIINKFEICYSIYEQINDNVTKNEVRNIISNTKLAKIFILNINRNMYVYFINLKYLT